MKRKRAYMCICLSAVAGMLAACSNSVGGPAQEENVILELDMHADLAYSANSIQELYDYSDFVAEIQVTGTEAQTVEGGGIIYTFFEGDVVTQHKGTYNGERFYTDGGYMNLGEYLDGVPDAENYPEYSDEERQNGLVYMNYMETHIPEVGETLLIFGKCFEEEGVIAISSLAQSIYVCDGDAVSINFRGDADAFVSDLQEDLQNSFDAQITQSDDHRTAVCSKEAFTAAFSS